MKKKDKFLVPDGFSRLIKDAMIKENVSLRQLAPDVGRSPSFLSRILSGKRKLPADSIILKLATALNIQPERLLIESGRIPVSNPRYAELFRATGPLTDRELQEVMKTVKKIARRKSRTPKRK